MSKTKKIPFKTIREKFSMLQVKWLQDGTTSYNFFLIPKSKEDIYIKQPNLVTETLEAVGFYTISTNSYDQNPDSYNTEIEKAFDGCIIQCMGQYGFFPEHVDF